MSEELNQSKDQEEINKKSAEWVVRHDKGLTAQELDDFFQWLAEDSRHGESFAACRQSWAEFNLLAQWRPEHSEEPNPDLLATIKPVRSWKRWCLISGLAAILTVSSFVWFPRLDSTVAISAAAGKVEAPKTIENYFLNDSIVDNGYYRLEDGSEIDFNAGTELMVSYSPERRLIKLISGEAHFTVKKNPSRPFIVQAGSAQVRAVGTAFNVRMDQDSLEILVTEGKVRMEGSIESSKSESADGISRDLVSGQKSVISFSMLHPTVEVITIRKEEIDRLLEWKPDVLDFSSTPLSEAIVKFNEFNEVKMVIADSELANQPIVASFRSNNINGFVRLLNLTMAIEAEYRGDREILLYQSH